FICISATQVSVYHHRMCHPILDRDLLNQVVTRAISRRPLRQRSHIHIVQHSAIRLTGAVGPVPFHADGFVHYEPSHRSPSTSPVCSPNNGGGLRMLAGVAENLNGIPTSRSSPIVGWGTVSTIPRALTCSLSSTSGTVRTGPTGTSAAAIRRIHSAAGAVRKCSASSATSV